MDFSAELNVTELFDLNDIFQSRIIDVCIARNDLAYINSLIHQNMDDTHFRMVFLFRQQIAMMREALKLISVLLCDQSKDLTKIKEFYNFEQINEKYKELCDCTDDLKYDKGTFMKEILAPVRNMISHYEDNKNAPQYSDVKDEEIISTITVYDSATFENCHGVLYTFADNVFFRSAMKKWKNYRKLECDDFYSIAEDFAKQYRKILVITILLLDMIFGGYYEKYLCITEDDDGISKITKKNSLTNT